MSQKICPLGFFSFFVNKNSAHAGGMQYCVKQGCQFWEELYDEFDSVSGQCAVVSISDSLRTASESLSILAEVSYSQERQRRRRLPVAQVVESVESRSEPPESPSNQSGLPPETTTLSSSNNGGSTPIEPGSEQAPAAAPAEAIAGILGGFLDKIRETKSPPPPVPQNKESLSS